MPRSHRLVLTPQRSPRRRILRATVVALAVLAVVAALWAVVMALLWGYATVRLGGMDLRALEAPEEALGTTGASAPDDATTILFVVTGSRDPTRPVTPELAAPVALVQFGPARTEPAVLLLPVELPVTIDGHGAMTITEVHGLGGAETLSRAIVDYTSIRVDHFVSATVDALPRLVDLVGGVELCIPEGCRAASGTQVRAAADDADPTTAVAAVASALEGVAAALDVRSVALSPLTAKRAIDVVATQIDTDVSLRGSELLRLAELLGDLPELSVDVVPMLRHPATGELIPLDEPAAVRFQHLREGTPLVPRDVRDELSGTLVGLRVAVLNGAGIDGLASRVEADLIAEGMRSAGTGNAPAFEHDTTTVTYAAGDVRVELAAILLAERLDADVERVERQPTFEGEDVDILVIAGANLDVERGG